MPDELYTSFQASLEEVHHADLVLHVIDLTNPDWLGQKNEVEKVLQQLRDRPRQGHHRVQQDRPAARPRGAARQKRPARSLCFGGERLGIAALKEEIFQNYFADYELFQLDVADEQQLDALSQWAIVLEKNRVDGVFQVDVLSSREKMLKFREKHGGTSPMKAFLPAALILLTIACGGVKPVQIDFHLPVLQGSDAGDANFRQGWEQLQQRRQRRRPTSHSSSARCAWTRNRRRSAMCSWRARNSAPPPPSSPRPWKRNPDNLEAGMGMAMIHRIRGQDGRGLPGLRQPADQGSRRRLDQAEIRIHPFQRHAGIPAGGRKVKKQRQGRNTSGPWNRRPGFLPT